MDRVFKSGEEKKVEFIELIYDLIFVYLIRRNIALFHHLDGRFFSSSTFLTFTLTTLVALQIWYFSTLYINRYGENSIREHIFLFINMYLLYFLADGLGNGHAVNYAQYSISWALILLNIAVQYLIQFRKLKGSRPWEETPIKAHAFTLIFQAALLIASIPLAEHTGMYAAWAVLLVGVITTFIGEHFDFIIPMDVEHMTERIMLYMVFSFGETIISISEYFEDGFTLETMYFSLIAFMIVAGLFMIYGLRYNRTVDRESHHIGFFYMLIHVGLVLSLNNITIGMEMIRLPNIDMLKCTMFLVASFICYYMTMYFLKFYEKKRYRAGINYLRRMILFSFLFVLISRFIYRSGAASIFVSCIYCYSMFIMVVYRINHVDKMAALESENSLTSE